MATVTATSTLFLELDGRDAGALRSAQPASVRVELLDAAMKKALATIELSGCLLLGMDEEPLGGSATDRPGNLVLRFDVGGMKLAVA